MHTPELRIAHLKNELADDERAVQERLRETPFIGPLVRALSKSTAPFHVETPAVQKRRRVVVIVTSLVGAAVLALTLNEPRSGGNFTLYALLLAAVWIVGAFASGPLHLGRWGTRRDLMKPIVFGVIAWAVFAVGALVVEQIPFLAKQVDSVISRANGGFWAHATVVAVAVVNGLAEEVFFRGAVYSAFGRYRPALWSTVVYVLVTAASANAPLVLAGAIMGTLWALERRATRGVLASSVTHATWAVMMIFLLPR